MSEDTFDLLCDFDLLTVFRPVDLRDKRLQDGRTWRHFGDFEARTVLVTDCDQFGTHALCNLMALSGTYVAVTEVYLDVGNIGATAQEVMADQTIEIVQGPAMPA